MPDNKAEAKSIAKRKAYLQDVQMVVNKLSIKATDNQTARKLISKLSDEVDYYTRTPDDFRYAEVSGRRSALMDMWRLLRDIEANAGSQRARADAVYASRQRRIAKEQVSKQADIVSQTEEDVRNLREQRMLREGKSVRRMMRSNPHLW